MSPLICDFDAVQLDRHSGKRGGHEAHFLRICNAIQKLCRDKLRAHFELISVGEPRIVYQYLPVDIAAIEPNESLAANAMTRICSHNLA